MLNVKICPPLYLTFSSVQILSNSAVCDDKRAIYELETRGAWSV